MKCCANCEWSISPELEDEIMKEQGYDMNDLTRPKAGDCVLGMTYDKNYCCSKHIYIEGMEENENYIFYDEEYLGIGYLIVTTLDEEVVKFIKISITNNSVFPCFIVRGFEKDSYDSLDNEFRTIKFTFQKDEPIYELVSKFAKSINNEKLYSIDSNEQGKNNLQLESFINEASIILSKDILGVKHATNFIDVLLGDSDTCKYYEQLLEFYKDLSELPLTTLKEEDIKKLLKTK